MTEHAEEGVTGIADEGNVDGWTDRHPLSSRQGVDVE
jgi:hypothetical protein